MPYLDGREPIQTITSFGKSTEGNFDVKNGINSQWRQKAPFAKPKLQFGLTHPDKVVSQVREKKTQDYNIKTNNIWKQSGAIPTKSGITSFGKSSPNDGRFPGNGTQFMTQSPQIQNRRGSTIEQYKKDKTNV